MVGDCVVCSRIAVSGEPYGEEGKDEGVLYHVLIELFPSGILWPQCILS